MALLLVTSTAARPGVLVKYAGHQVLLYHPDLPPAERDALFAELLGPEWPALVESAHAYVWTDGEDDALTG